MPGQDGSDGSLLTGLPTEGKKSIIKTRSFAWWLEIISVLVGFIALFAIVATLYPHQGKPLPQWPFGISINTLLSIYSFVLRAAIPVVVGSCLCQLQWGGWFSVERPLIDVVRYDSAAKGPLGAIQWLWANHISHPLTALGAFITIASVIIDPFVQQLILYGDCYTTLGMNASLARTNYLEYQGVDVGLETQILAPEAESAVDAGLFGSPDAIEAVCSTGNCTFPRHYASLGYCSACQDISHLVEFDIYTTTDNNTTSLGNITSTLPSGLSTFWELNEGTVFAGKLVNWSYNSEVQLLQGATYWSWSGTDPELGMNEKVVGCDSAEANATLWKCRLANAISCKLQPCVRVYNASVAAGKLNETVVDSSPIDQEWGDILGYIYSVVDTQCTSAQENTSLSQLGYNLDGGRWLAYNSTISEENYTQIYPIDAPFPYSLYAHECVYSINSVWVGDLWTSEIDSLFSGNLTGYMSDIFSLSGVDGLQSLQKLYNYSDTSFQLIEETFQNISESLTNYIRINGAANQSVPVTGQVVHYATCLEVRWPWIALPASVIIGTGALLVLTIINVYRDTLPIWKTTILPILFNGPAIRINPETPLTTEANMAKEAAKINVILDREAESLKLVRT